MQATPQRKTVLDFKFSRLCSLRLFPTTSKLDRKHPLNVLATSNKFGLIFAGTPSGVHCIPLSDVVEIQGKRANNRGVIENYTRRELNLGCTPSHIAVNSSGDFLAVVVIHQQCPVLQIYYVQSFASQEIVKMSEVRLGSPGSRVLDLQWNPAIPNTIGAVMSDGSAFVVEINLSSGAPTISSAPPATQATCLCWSPKGKQVVLGSSNGNLTQYKPDLKPVKSYPPPQIGNAQFAIISIHWISSFQFIVVYKDKVDPQSRSAVMVVNVPKNAPQSFVNFEDACFGSDAARHEHYFIHIAAWNLMVISTGNGLEACILAQEGDSWVQWDQDEGGRAELPQTENHDDVFTVGMTLNINATNPIPVGDTGSIPPMPFLFMMSEEGVLCIFHMINMLPNAADLCSPPNPLPKQFFTAAAAGEPAALSIPSETPSQLVKTPSVAQSGVGSGEGPIAEKPSLFGSSGSPFLSAQTGPPPTQSPFTLTSAGLQMPSFGQSAQSPLVQGKPSLPSMQQNVPKSQLPFGFGPTISPQNTSSGLFGLQSKPSEAQAPSITTSASLGVPFSAAPATIAQSVPKTQPTTTIAPPVLPPHSSATGITIQPVPIEALQPPPKVEAPPPGPPPVDEAMLKNEIQKEVQSIRTLLRSCKVDAAAVSKLMNDTVSLPSIQVKLDDLETFEKELRETTLFQQNETHATRVSLVEKWGLLENVKAKQRQSTSQRYLETIESRELDPVMKRLMSSIAQNASYIETKIAETTRHLNSLWEEQKRPGSLKNFDIPSMETIYQIILTNYKNLAQLQERVKNIENKMEVTLKLSKKKIPRVLNVTNPKWSGSSKTSLRSDTQLEQLADKLLQTRLDTTEQISHSFKETSSRYIALANFRKPVDNEKEDAVWKTLKSHKVIRTKVTRSAMPENEILNRSLASSTPSKSPIPIAETPQISSREIVSRNLFSSPGTTVPSSNTGLSMSMVTSTPIVSTSKSGEPKGLIPVPAFDVSSAIKSATEVTTQASATKSIFATGTTPSFTFKDQPAATTTSSLPFGQTMQAVYSKIEISPLSPQLVPKESSKSIVSRVEFSKPSGDEKFAPNTTVLPKLSFGATVTVADKEKPTQSSPMAPATAAGTIFGGGLNFVQTTASTTFSFEKPSFGSMFPSSLGAPESSSTTTAKVSTLPFSSASSVGGVTTPSSLKGASGGQTLFSTSPFQVPQTKPVETASARASATTTASISIAPTTNTFPSTFSTSTATSFNTPYGSNFTSTPVFGSVPSIKATTASAATSASSLAETSAIVSSAASPAAPAQVSSYSTPVVTSAVSPMFGAGSAVTITPVSQKTVMEKTSTAAGLPSFGDATLASATCAPTFTFPSPQVSTTTAFVTQQSNLNSTAAPGTTTSQTVTSPAFVSGATSSTVFGGTGTSNIFGGTPKIPSSAVFGGTTNKTISTSSVFGEAKTTPSSTEFAGTVATTTSTALAGTLGAMPPATTLSETTVTPTSTVFGGTTTTSTVFGGTPTTTSSTLFGGAPATTSSTIFGGTPATTSSGVFSGVANTTIQPGFVGTASTTSASIFGGTAPTTAASAFSGTVTASPSNLFQTPQKSAAAFGGTPVFGTPTGATAVTSPQPTFGTGTTPQSVFGSQPTSTLPPFGSQPSPAPSFTGTTASSVFGTPTQTTTNVFGAANALSNTSFFGSPTTTASAFGGATPAANIFGGSSSFSTPSTTTSSIFGATICSPSTTQPSSTSNVFGSPFGQKTASPSTPFGGSPGFGSFRPSAPGGFGSSGGSMFGGGSTFGQPAQQGGLFQSGNASPNVFGSPTQATGAFSASGQTVQQTGFGAFGRGQSQQPRPFGASGGPVFGGQANFGAPPAFGGAATFGGSPTNKVFGATTPAAPAFGAPTQQNATFENLAGQNTVSFGNLAQSQPAFGSNNAFGQPQQQQPPQQQQQQQQQSSAFSNTPGFGGSSFSSWR